MLQWNDGTMAYVFKYQIYQHACAAMERAGAWDLIYNCPMAHGGYVLCEKDDFSLEKTISLDDEQTRFGIQLPVPSNSTVHLAQTLCPSGHWTHEFLACDTQSACWQQDSVRQWTGSKTRRNMTSPCQFPFSEMFTCTSGVGRVPYSLVCDHSQDCLDNSDEDFCVHPSCTNTGQFECTNKQVSLIAFLVRGFICCMLVSLFFFCFLFFFGGGGVHFDLRPILRSKLQTKTVILPSDCSGQVPQLKQIGYNSVGSSKPGADRPASANWVQIGQL